MCIDIYRKTILDIKTEKKNIQHKTTKHNKQLGRIWILDHSLGDALKEWEKYNW